MTNTGDLREEDQRNNENGWTSATTNPAEALVTIREQLHVLDIVADDQARARITPNDSPPMTDQVSHLIATTDPAGALREIVTLREQLHVLEIVAVDQARAHGMTWQTIGALLGVTKQAVQQRYTTLAPQTFRTTSKP